MYEKTGGPAPGTGCLEYTSVTQSLPSHLSVMTAFRSLPAMQFYQSLEGRGSYAGKALGNDSLLVVMAHCCFQRFGRVLPQAWHKERPPFAWSSACCYQVPVKLFPVRTVASVLIFHHEGRLFLLGSVHAAQLVKQSAPVTGLEELPEDWMSQWFLTYPFGL